MGGLAHRARVTPASSQLEHAPLPPAANRSLRRNALLITAPRFAGAVILGMSARFSSDIALKPVAYAGVAALLLANLLILASKRFPDRQARRAVACSVAVDFVVMTSVLLNVTGGSTPAYMGHVLIGLEAAALFRMRGFVVFLCAFAAVGWIPLWGTAVAGPRGDLLAVLHPNRRSGHCYLGSRTPGAGE